jgi:cytochrome c553
MLPASDPRSTVNRSNLAETCGKCHGRIRNVFDQSVHGRAA